MSETKKDKKEDAPKVAFALQHLLSVANALTLEVDLFKQKGIYLLKLHTVFLTQVLILLLQAVKISLKADFVFVDGFPKTGKDIELVFIYEGY